MQSASDKHQQRYYIFYHAVVRADSTTTKTHVVLDALCRTDSGNKSELRYHESPGYSEQAYLHYVSISKTQIRIFADIDKNISADIN